MTAISELPGWFLDHPESSRMLAVLTRAYRFDDLVSIFQKATIGSGFFVIMIGREDDCLVQRVRGQEGLDTIFSEIANSENQREFWIYDLQEECWPTILFPLSVELSY